MFVKHLIATTKLGFLFIYLFNFANYIHIHTRITYNGQMAGNMLQLTAITAAL